MLVVAGLEVDIGGRRILGGIELAVAAGEMVSVLGPTGTGKSTLLRAVAGLVAPRAGRVEIGGRIVCRDGVELVPPESRGVGMVFQDRALWPHLDVDGNIAATLRGRLPRAAIGRRTAEVRELVGIEALARRHPPELSGGEQQLVALARAVAPRPRLLLLDEPLSNLDPGARARVVDRLLELERRLELAVIVVTHDRHDAFALGDRTVVMREGGIEQVGPPEALYARPASRFVAELSGPTNLLGGVVEAPGAVRTAIGSLAVATDGRAPGARVTAVLRPEQVVAAAGGAIHARVVRCDYRGDRYLCRAETDAGVRVLFYALEPFAAGAATRLDAPAGPAWLIDEDPSRGGG